MKSFKINGKEYSMISSWSEMSLEQYISFYKMHEKRKDAEIDDLYLIELLEFFSGCDEILLAPQSELGDLLLNLNFLMETPTMNSNKHLKFEDKNYSFVDFNKLTTGEYISIKMLQKSFPNPLDCIPYILSIILRPSTISVDAETGEDVYIIEEFKTENIEWRAKNYRNMFKAIDVINFITFFLTMRNQSMKTTQSSSKVDKKVVDGHPKSLNNTIG